MEGTAMSGATTTSAITASYLALVRRFPLRPIRNEKDYEAASEVLDRLAVRDEQTLDAGERDYLETLEMLVEAYDCALYGNRGRVTDAARVAQVAHAHRGHYPSRIAAGPRHESAAGVTGP